MNESLMRVFSGFIYKDNLRAGLNNQFIKLNQKLDETFFESHGLIFIDTKNSKFGEMISESLGGSI